MQLWWLQEGEPPCFSAVPRVNTGRGKSGVFERVGELLSGSGLKDTFL